MSDEGEGGLVDLLPWLANGTLVGAERVAVESLLARSPEATKELRLWKAVQAEVEREPLNAGVDMGWRRLEKQLKKAQPQGGAPRYWRVAAAAAVATIIGLQSTMLWRMNEDGDITQMAGPTVVVDANEWHVQVRFAEGATVAQMSELLAQADARIVNGPSALGVYDIAVTRTDRFADTAALLEWLLSQPIVLEGTLPPPAEGAVPP